MGKAYKKPTTDSQKKLVEKISGYSYKVTPVNGKFNNIFFVETDNPDPNSFQFVDESSKYLGKGKTALLKPLSFTYYDVQYSNTKTRRIANKGYLFYCYECDTDGGTLRLVANEGYSYQSTSFGASYNDGTNYDTGKGVAVASVEDRVDYLIRTYAAGKSSFWDKLDAVEAGLNAIALYPKSLKDTSKPNADAYPALACSPYAELGWNEHIEGMFQSAEDGLFLNSAYGFVLDSLSFPGMIGSVAERLQPSCSVGVGYVHWLIDVSYGGKTQTYGGAGTGSSDPLYSKFVNWKFKFDGTDKGYGTNLSMTTLYNARIACAKNSDELASQYLDQISMTSVAKAVGQGAWVRVAYEGFLGGGQTIGYATMSAYGESSTPASDAWVDGRYVNEYERWEPGAKFSEHPKADIILSNVTYKRDDGTTVKGNVTYRYQSDTDDWRATRYYTYGFTSYFGTLPSVFILTRAQVNSMVSSGQIDGKTSVVPKAGYIFDGSAKPGTYTSDLSKS